MTLLKDKVDKTSKTPLLDLLSDENNWCQNENFYEGKVPASAEKCCIVGGITLCYPESAAICVIQTLSNLIRPEKMGSIDSRLVIVDFNDSVTHSDIVKLLKKAQV